MNQIDLANERFRQLRGAIPPLAAMAEKLGIPAIRSDEDIAALAFPAAFYKSYPESLLERFDFPAMTQWLSRLTAHDLSPLAGRSFDSIDGWLEALETETPLVVKHSSGTTGRMSFVRVVSPTGKRRRAQPPRGTGLKFSY